MGGGISNIGYIYACFLKLSRLVWYKLQCSQVQATLGRGFHICKQHGEGWTPGSRRAFFRCRGCSILKTGSRRQKQQPWQWRTSLLKKVVSDLLLLSLRSPAPILFGHLIPANHCFYIVPITVLLVYWCFIIFWKPPWAGLWKLLERPEATAPTLNPVPGTTCRLQPKWWIAPCAFCLLEVPPFKNHCHFLKNSCLEKPLPLPILHAAKKHPTFCHRCMAALCSLRVVLRPRWRIPLILLPLRLSHRYLRSVSCPQLKQTWLCTKSVQD